MDEEASGVDDEPLHLGADLESEPGEDPQSVTVVDDEPIPQDVYDRALFDAQQAISQDVSLQLPWESGVFGAIFGGEMFPLPSPSDVMPQQSIPETSDDLIEQIVQPHRVTASANRSADVPVHTRVMTDITDVDAVKEEEQLWELAVSKWHFIFATTNWSGVIGDRLMNLLCRDDPWTECRLVIRDVLGTKSPRTAIKRADTLRKFFRWVISCDCSPWPIYSSRVLAYLSKEGGNPAASSGMALLEAFRFAHFVMGIEIGHDVMADPQILGRVKRLGVQRSEVQQARPLLCSEVAAMEKFMQSSKSVGDSYIVGCCLFAIFSRSRWSDMKYMYKIQVDRYIVDKQPFGFVEGTTRFHKTSTSMERKTRYMPLVCPLLGVTGIEWVPLWMDAAVQLGFDFDAVPVGALCRAIGRDGKLTKRHCTTTEVTNFLNRFLNTDDSNRATSHCLKETSLSWSAKWGTPEDARTLLGHHELAASGKSKSLATYSRDMLSRPLQFYVHMLEQIRKDAFRPDMSRSGWMSSFVSSSAAPEIPRHQQQRPVQTPSVKSVVPSPSHSFDLGDGNGNQESEYESINEQAQEELDSIFKSAGIGLSANTAGLDSPIPGPEQAEQDNHEEELESVESSSTSSSSSDDDMLEEAMHEKLTKHSELDIAEPLFQNKRSRVLHRPGDSETVLMRGVKVSDRFQFLERGSVFKWPRCGKCFKGEVLSTSSQVADALAAMAAKRRKVDE